MIEISLIAAPSQSVAFVAEGLEYTVDVKDTGGCVAVTIARDGVALVSGLRVLAGAPLLPSAYLEGAGGNFLFLTDADALPAWQQFGLTQFLLYLTAAELAAIRAA